MAPVAFVLVLLVNMLSLHLQKVYHQREEFNSVESIAEKDASSNCKSRVGAVGREQKRLAGFLQNKYSPFELLRAPQKSVSLAAHALKQSKVLICGWKYQPYFRQPRERRHSVGWVSNCQLRILPPSIETHHNVDLQRYVLEWRSQTLA